MPCLAGNDSRDDSEGEQFLVEQPLTEAGRFLVPHGPQKVADLAARAARPDDAKPFRVRSHVGRRDDLDHVPIVKLGA